MTCPAKNNKQPPKLSQAEVIYALPDELSSSNRQNLLKAINSAWFHSWGWHRYDSYRTFEQEITQAGSKLLLIQEKDNYIGGAFYLADAPEAPEMLYFGTLWTAPHKHKKGQGSMLISLLEQEAKTIYKKGIHIAVNFKLPQMIAFYKKRGYTTKGDSKQYSGFICMEKFIS